MYPKKKALLLTLYTNRHFFYNLVIRDLKSRYLGSVFGLLWAFMQPLTTLIIIWFVFQYGFKVLPLPSGVPFSLWLVAGMVPWFFIAETLSTSTYSILEQAQILKKVVLSAALLPLVKLASALVIHIFFLILLFFLAIYSGYQPTYQWFYVVYYLFSASCLLLGIAWITSSIIVFFKDLGQIVGVIVQVGFWATPIFWSLSNISVNYHFLFKLNPAFYVIDGYRNSILSTNNMVIDVKWTLYFWCVTVILMLVGSLIFRKLEKHFSEVL